ncbi:MAG: chemotaxis protein [Opitutales bacterium]
MLTYLLAIALVFALLAGWIGVQALARAFAARHPELGPAREEGVGCAGLLCRCKAAGDCPRERLLLRKTDHTPAREETSPHIFTP